MTYTQVSGVIAGMLSMGYIADMFGRKNGSRITSLVMLIGCILLLASSGPTPSDQFTMFTAALCIFGYGVGVRVKSCSFAVCWLAGILMARQGQLCCCAIEGMGIIMCVL